MQVCTSLQTANYASTPALSYLQAGCPSCRPTNTVKALKAKALKNKIKESSRLPASQSVRQKQQFLGRPHRPAEHSNKDGDCVNGLSSSSSDHVANGACYPPKHSLVIHAIRRSPPVSVDAGPVP